MTDSPTKTVEEQAVELAAKIFQLMNQEQDSGKLHIFCTSPEAIDLTRRQKAALHLCKHEVFSAFFRLFEHVPPKVVATIAEQAISAASAPKRKG